MPTRVPRIAPSEITPPQVYFNRRALLAGALAGGGAARCCAPRNCRRDRGRRARRYTRNPRYSVGETPNKYEEITTYNNFYEFGTDKDSPSEQRPHPQDAALERHVDGEAEKRGTFDLEDLLKGQALEERVYRFRCVEAWSMVVPWVGFPLSNLLDALQADLARQVRRVHHAARSAADARAARAGAALAVRRGTAHRRGHASARPSWWSGSTAGAAEPGRRAAAARSCRGSTASRASSRSSRSASPSGSRARPGISAAPNEYGFYANVNPKVDHPRWSQATERRIGAPFLAARRPTLPVQRLRRRGREPLPGHGPAALLLTTSPQRYRFVYKPLVFIACLLPLALASIMRRRRLVRRRLGADPVKRARARVRQDRAQPAAAHAGGDPGARAQPG